MRELNRFPPGWDERSVREVIDYYENQTDEEAAAEHAAALAADAEMLVPVPTELVPKVQRLIARHKRDRAA